MLLQYSRFKFKRHNFATLNHQRVAIKVESCFLEKMLFPARITLGRLFQPKLCVISSVPLGRAFHGKQTKTWQDWEALDGKGNIILMGPPGSGKTTTGRLLSHALNGSVLDVDDHLLTPWWQMSVADKLAQIGDKRFLEEEGRALLNLDAEKTVVSLSGSNPLHFDSMAKVAQSGLVVYLDATTDTILKRQERMLVDRIIGMEDGKTLGDVIDSRKEVYEQWYDIRVTIHQTDTEEDVANRVLSAVEGSLEDPGYLSTRSAHLQRTRFLDVVLQGLAPDGGLYVKPSDRIPRMSVQDLARLVPMSMVERSLRILESWIHPLDICPQELRHFLTKSYTQGLFDHPQMCPVTKLDQNLFTQELFHGPTASFKDWALQLMPRFFTKAMKQQSQNARYLILTATSGDTGSATLDGFSRHAGNSRVGVLVLCPAKNISTVQKRQTCTMEGRNVKAIGVHADFDFCQRTVKQIFQDPRVKEELADCGLSAANSINWGRLLPQVLYHTSAYLDLVKFEHIQMGEPIDLCVPTGNFGNILSAFYAREMGVPIRRLICASNENNVLTEFIHNGVYNPGKYRLKQTISPSIDIRESSNLERFVYHLWQGDSKALRRFYQEVAQQGYAQVPEELLHTMRSIFKAGFATEQDTKESILNTYQKTGYLPDPHTAVALHVASVLGDPTIPTVVSGTAHYGKFIDTIHPLLHQEDSTRHKSISEMLAQMSGMAERPKMNTLLVSMATKPILHTDEVDPNYEEICERVIQFAKTL